MESNIVTGKSKIMLIALLAIITLITILFIYIGNLLQKHILETIIKEEKKVAIKIYQQTFDDFISRYESIASNLLLNKEIINSFQKKDRSKLLGLTLPVYEKLHKENPYLQVMHFHTSDTRSFLRLHKPQKYGDDLISIRHMINKVNKLKVKQIGIEVGRYGIHYRLALPVFNSNKDFLGVFEFGININYILDIFENKYNFETLLLFKKDIFDIVFKNYNDIAYLPYSEDCYSIKLENNNSMTVDDNAKNTTFKVNSIQDNAKQNIGEILLIKNLNVYTEDIEKIVNIAVTVAVLFVLLAFYLTKRIFDNYLKIINSYKEKLEIKNHSLVKLSNTDHLTQIHNRKSIENILNNEIKRSKRHMQPLCVIILDVDNFKSINDTLGHNVGDKVLSGLAKLVSSHLRETDHCGRWGGEEFIIVLTDTSLNNGVTLTEKIREKIYTHDFGDIKNVSCSFGIAECTTEDTCNAIIYDADTALYEAKNSGKNKVSIYNKKSL
ncbi:MAG: diguanylate cyclase (GGDEF)-like protein [Sulfurimonas sp.]|jgi:diguanylate cyclase (GGDEF)-like protein|uniref:sensor domain-containing diguanylate cyclase n=1 Tax=Sulfurimonas sp. TaxID=2022749 RepID=UPI0039E28387